MRTLFDSRLKFIAAAVATVGTAVALPKVGHAQTVTFILSVNDDGSGNFVSGDYAIYAAESGAGTYGFDGIGVNVGGVNNPSDFLEDDLPIGTATPGSTNTAKKAPSVMVGFTEGYGASFPIGGGQDTPDLANSLLASKPPATFLTYGVGQVSGSEDATVAAIGGSGSKFTPSPAGTGTDAYGSTIRIAGPLLPEFGETISNAVLVADGTFAPGETPAFVTNNNSALLFVENGQANFNPLGGNTESIGESGITFLTGFPLPPTLFGLGGSAGNGGTDDAPAFGAADVSDVVTVGPGNGNYTPLKAVVNNDKGFFAYSGFSQGDAVDVALKFTSNGSPISAAEILAIVDYINSNSGGGIGPILANTFSSAPAAVQSALGGSGAYDILLSGEAGANDPFAFYDFSGFTADPNLEVTGIGIVPEPAGLAVLCMISLGLLNSRWHNRAITLPTCGG